MARDPVFHLVIAAKAPCLAVTDELPHTNKAIMRITVVTVPKSCRVSFTFLMLPSRMVGKTLCDEFYSCACVCAEDEVVALWIGIEKSKYALTNLIYTS